jgi:hypothetical protein
MLDLRRRPLGRSTAARTALLRFDGKLIFEEHGDPNWAIGKLAHRYCAVMFGHENHWQFFVLERIRLLFPKVSKRHAKIKSSSNPRIKTQRQFPATLRHRLFQSPKKETQTDAHPVPAPEFPRTVPSRRARIARHRRQ